MKKFRYIIATVFVVAMGLAIFFACEKENNNESYNEKGISNKIQKEKLPPEEAAQVAGADLKAVPAGAAGGAAVGAAIGGPVGAGIGAGIGGVVAGLGASLEKWGQIKASHDSLVKGVSQNAMAVIYDEAGNDENPYDSVGLIHYQLINYFILNEYLFESNNVFDPELYYANAIILLPQYYPMNTTLSYSQYFSYIEFQNASMETNSSSLNELFDITIENVELRSTLLEYEQERVNSTSFSSFYDCSILVENEVLNNENINDLDKQIALSYMATARYGYWYWIVMYGNK
ncbi:MAG: hypothetical protein GX638_08790 [Crenarchaeota archaeon]|nr:hypothetical protein [Thermoproteota archaeon]